MPPSSRLPGLAGQDASFLLEPLAGYPLAVAPEIAERLETAHRELLDAGRVEAARQVAASLLAGDPDLEPAKVLAAEADFAELRDSAVVDRLGPVVEGLPSYLAAEVLLGRAAERTGDVPRAYVAFREVAGSSSLAADRASALQPRALEIVSHRVDDALRRGHLDEAEQGLERLRSWAPEDAVTYRTAAAVARATGDRQQELAAVDALAQLEPDDRQIEERRAALELEVGDPSTGLEILGRLAARYPDDPDLRDRLGYAKFRWRLSLLPASVQQLADRPELTRGEFAALLYWLVPGVRYGKPAAARIAADILDDPHREEIARVVNLGLMDVDESLHRFSPGAPLLRGAALAAVVRLVADADPPAACAQGFVAGQSTDLVCATAARCAFVPSPADCLPGAPMSGREALDLLRHAVEHLGGR